MEEDGKRAEKDWRVGWLRPLKCGYPHELLAG